MATLFVLLSLPNLVFTVAGVLLWKRWRSKATSLVAFGFAAELFVQLARLFTYLTFQPPIEAHQQGEPFAFKLYYLAAPWQHYVESVGIWAASLGLLWHASRKREAGVS